MYIHFEEIEIKNFLSYGVSPTLIRLDSHSTTLLLGASGSGKSSIPNALSFVLFDDTLRGVQKHQLVNSSNAKNCWVKVSFKIGSDSYSIKRGIKPNILEVSKNGNILNKDAKVTDLQEYIETHILKFDKKTFNQIVSLAEVNFVPFMMLTAKDRRAFIEKVLGVEIFSVMNNLLKIESRDNAEAIRNIDNEIANTSEKVSIHQNYIEKAKKDNKAKREEHNSEAEKANVLCLKYKASIKLLEEKLKPFLSINNERRNVNNEITNTKIKVSQVESSIINENKRRNAILNNDTCPTCEQKFPKKQTEAKITEIDKKIEQLETTKSKVCAKLEELEKKLERYENNDSEIAEIEEQISVEATKEQKYSETAKIHLKEAAKYSVNNADNIKQIIKEIEELENKKTELQADLIERHELKSVHDIALQILKDDGIKSEIVRSYIPKINLLVNRFLESMGYNLLFSIDHEFNEQIKTNGKESYTYCSFSAGQRQRIDLALLLTWRSVAKSRNSVNTNLLFLDEVVDSHLNASTAESIIDIFNGESFKGSNVFVISHKEDISQKFNRVLNFELENGFTHIS